MRNFTTLREGFKAKKVLEHHQTVECPQKGTQVELASVWCTSIDFYLQILILKPSTPNLPNFSISINFTNPLRKTIHPQIYPKITKTFTERLEMQRYVEMSGEIFDCLKCKRDFCVKTIITLKIFTEI